MHWKTHNMAAIEVLYAVLLIGLGFVSSKTDLKEGIIYNRHLKFFLICAVVLGIIYYGYFARDIFMLFLVNLFIVSFASLLLFYTHSFAGGDCKLAIIMAGLYPANYYITYGNWPYTLVLAIMFAVIIGYLYLFVLSFKSIAMKETNISIDLIKDYFVSFIKNFAIATIYISCLTLFLYWFQNNGFIINPWIVRFFCLFIAWIVSHYNILKNRYLVMAVAIIDLFLCLYLKFIPFSINPEHYIIVLLLLVFQFTIQTNIYEEIPVENLKPGMILTTFASVIMQGSRIKGLPGISSEDLKCRLTEEEVISIKSWAATSKIDYISIVKKIPFAIFISLGYASYFLIWSLLR